MRLQRLLIYVVHGKNWVLRRVGVPDLVRTDRDDGLATVKLVLLAQGCLLLYLLLELFLKLVLVKNQVHDALVDICKIM